MSEPRGPLPRYWLCLIALLAGIVTLQLVWVDPGPMTIDEVTYERMTHDLLAGHGFLIENGYEEVASDELTSMLISPTADGHLAAQYPYGQPIVTAPLYVLVGSRAAFLLNALAFVLSIALTLRIAMQLVADRWIAATAAALVIATYFTEYALAAFPHATSVAAMLGAFTLSVSAHRALASDTRRALWLYAATGLVTGLGMTFRLDVFLCIPALGAPLFFASPTRWAHLVAIVVGLVPGAAFIALTNYARWGALSPMSYGPTSHDPSVHNGFLVAAVLITIIAWVATRKTTAALLRGRRDVVLGGALVTLATLILLRPRLDRDLLGAMSAVHATVAFVVDLRLRPNVIAILGDSVAIVLGGAFKKALLQSAPILVLAIIPMLRAVRDRELRRTVAWLLVLPLTVIGFFGVRTWHGGYCLNLRYALVALPFLCILAAYGLRELRAALPRTWLAIGTVPLVVTAAFYMEVHTFEFYQPDDEDVLLTTPIVLMGLLAIALVAWDRVRGTILATIALVLTGSALGWTVGATIEDARWSHKLRSTNHAIGECIAERITDDALLLSEFPDHTYAIVSRRPHVRVALPMNDQFATTRALIAWHLARGHRVFAAAGPTLWKLLRKQGALDGYAVDTIDQVGMFALGEIRPARPGEPSTGLITDIHLTRPGCGPSHTLWPYRFDPRLDPPPPLPPPPRT